MKNYRNLTNKKAGLKRYQKEIFRTLPGSAAEKKETLAQLRRDMACFLTENPNASYADLEREFGSPAEAASAYIGSFSGEELTKTLRLKKIHFHISVLALSIMIALLSAFAYWHYRQVTTYHAPTVYYYNDVQVPPPDTSAD